MNLPYRITLLTSILTGLAYCLTPSAGFSDQIYFKDGKMIEGVILDSGGTEVLVDTAGGTFVFQRTMIDRIVEGSEFDNVLAQARLEDVRKNHRAALDYYIHAMKLAQTDEQKQLVINGQRKAVQGFVHTLESREPLQHGLDDIREIEQLKTKLSDPVTLQTLQSMKVALDNKIAQAHVNIGKKQILSKNFEEAIEHFELVLRHYPQNPSVRGLDKQMASLYNQLGEQEFQYGKGNLEKAEQAFKSALRLEPDNNITQLYLGLIAFERENFVLADQYLQGVSQSGLTGWQSGRLKSALSRIKLELTPKPAPASNRTFIQTRPEPTTQPVEPQSLMERLTQWWNNAASSVKSLGDGSTDVVAMILSILKVLGAGIGVLIVFWYIPMKIVVRDLPNRKVLYYNWRKIVQYTGLIGLLVYFIDRFLREQPAKRCPSCSRSLENPSLFENYEFDQCPYCQTKIKPVFNLPELIQMQSDAILLAKRHSGGETDESQRQQMSELVNLLMVHGRRLRASDIHIEPEEKTTQVRYRVDGVLTDSIPLDRMLQSFLISNIKVMCNLNIAEKRVPQDGHFRRLILGEDINVRVSTIPTNHGEKGVLRLLDQRMVSTTLDRLGMREETLEQYRRAVMSPHGVILATGPTGSGKTTLLYASLQFVHDGTKNIITVEDPIEYELDGINQIQHNSATGMTFANALKSILRQDPDIIMVGEIRDLETATIAVNAALTGHMVYSTLHTTDTSQTLSRLIDIGVDVKLLSSSIQCIVAQRLVRKLCPHCKKSTQATAEEIARLGNAGSRLEGQNIHKEKGCRECNQTGFIGRTGIYEILIPSREIRNLIERSAPSMDIREASIKAGMKTLREEGIYKVLSGITSVNEVIRVTSDEYSYETDESETSPQQSNLVRLENNH